MKNLMWMFSILCIGILIFNGCSKVENKEGVDNTPVFAEIQGKKITEKQFDQELEKISPFAKNQFSGVEGKMKMLERMMQNEIMYKAALDAGLDKSEEVKTQIEDYKKNMIIREFYKKEIQDKSDVNDEETKAYYEQNKDKYVDKARVKVRHVLFDTDAEAQKARKELKAGANFNDMAKNRSKDKLSAKREGLLGNVIKGGYIPTIGKDEAIENALFALNANEISNVIQSKKGYHIFLVEEKKEDRQKDFEEVKELIKGELKRDKLRQDFDAKMEALKAKYNVKINEDALKTSVEKQKPEEQQAPLEEMEFKFDEEGEGKAIPEEKKPAEQGKPAGQSSINDVKKLFQLAAEQKDDPKKALDIYDRIIRDFPKDEKAYQAQFMVGFIYSEQLKDKDNAVKAYQKVLSDYPNCDLVESAKYMLKELQNPEAVAGFEGKKNKMS